MQLVVYQIVLCGDATLIHDHLRRMAWVQHIDVEFRGSFTIWHLSASHVDDVSSRLLRAILADSGLRVIRFNHLHPPPGL